MKFWLQKRGRGFLPADEESETFHQRLDDGEAIRFKPMRVRDPVDHRRYWGLMELCAQNCERIDLPYGGVMVVKSKDDVHTAMKLCTGYCDTIFDAFGKPAFLIPKSTSFDEMTADEWNSYWPRVLDVVQEQILPGVNLSSVQLEIMKCMGIAA